MQSSALLRVLRGEMLLLFLVAAGMDGCLEELPGAGVRQFSAGVRPCPFHPLFVWKGEPGSRRPY
jgi:hypothetical protein